MLSMLHNVPSNKLLDSGIEVGADVLGVRLRSLLLSWIVLLLLSLLLFEEPPVDFAGGFVGKDIMWHWLSTSGIAGVAHILILIDSGTVLPLVGGLNVLLLIGISFAIWILLDRSAGLRLAIRLLHWLQEQLLELLGDALVHVVDLVV